MPTIRQILKEQIATLGGDGLCNPEYECGCGLDDFQPCDAIHIDECKPAKKGENGLYYMMEEKK